MILEEYICDSIKLNCGYFTYKLLKTSTGMRIWECENHCMNWDCNECIPRLINRWKSAIKQALNRRNGPHVFIGLLHISRKELRKFINVNLGRGVSFLKIFVTGGVYLIATRSFPGSTRRHKDKFITRDLDLILNDSWRRSGRERRISSSKDFVKLPKVIPSYKKLADLNSRQACEIEIIRNDNNLVLEYLRTKVDEKRLTRYGRRLIFEKYPDKPNGANPINIEHSYYGISEGGVYANNQ